MIEMRAGGVIKSMQNFSKEFYKIYNCLEELKDKQEFNEKRIVELEDKLVREKMKNAFFQKTMESFINLLGDFFSRQNQLEGDKDIEKILLNTQSPLVNVYDETIFKIIDILFKGKCRKARYGDLPHFDLLCLWGFKNGYIRAKFLQEAIISQSPLLYLEDGFIRSIVPVNNKKALNKYKVGHSIIIDDLGLHINAKWKSRLERLLNSDIKLTHEQLGRSRNLINIIVTNRISKYNHQPIFIPQIGREGRKKVLVIDQVYGDQSIYYGLANTETFANMLRSAIDENPHADIIVKTHPATKNSSQGGFYQNLNEKNIYKITYDINPISLLQYVDKVYVCTSQMGFEAVLCGKEVHVFGMPFYAGWGVTNDRQVCVRRTRKRTLEELFYLIYIVYSKYVSYKTESICEIEQVLQEILELRSEYFKETLALKEKIFEIG